jgi:hypothetical protein
MRYLESCLADLKAAHARCPHQSNTSHIPTTSHTSTPTATSGVPASQAVSVDEDSDEEMSEATSPRSSVPLSHHHHNHSNSAHSRHSLAPSVSPALLPSTRTSPALSSNPMHRYSFASHSGYSSALPSPAFDPQQVPPTSGPAAYSTFLLTSPAIEAKTPTRESAPMSVPADKDDHEATAALLMLNTDRRSWSGPTGGRGMSVRDLLSG